MSTPSRRAHLVASVSASPARWLFAVAGILLREERRLSVRQLCFGGAAEAGASRCASIDPHQDETFDAAFAKGATAWVMGGEDVIPVCLAIPALITEKSDDFMATCDILGVTREVALDLTPQAEVGDYVLVHAGFAIEVVDEQYAKETIDLIKEIPELVDVPVGPSV